MRRFERFTYPDGCRCSACGIDFTDGDILVDRVVGTICNADVTAPVCPGTCETSPLQPDHPFADAEQVTFCADGTVDAG